MSRAKLTDKLLSLTDAAAHLGVHYMTAYRYVRTGRLPAHQEGGEWRVALSDLDGFLAMDQAPAPAARGRARPERYRDRLILRLLEGDEPGAWSIVESAIFAGTEPAQVYLELLAPALSDIGDRWAAGETSVVEEHRATAVATRIIGRLGPSFARRGRPRGTIVVGAAPGDRHALPVAMLRDLLRGAGYAVIDLGADVPADSFVTAATEAKRLLACAVGVATDAAIPGAAAVVEALHSVDPGLRVFVGGPAIRGLEHARKLGADAYAADATAIDVELSEPTVARVHNVIEG